MNLIQQLQQTPKWKEFEEWYNTQMVDNNYISLTEVWLSPDESDVSYQIGALQLPFDFLKGVFEKFIESQDHNLYQETDFYQLDSLPVTRCEESFEELLIWYFNN